MKRRIVATLPLISIFLLLLFGFGFDNWRLGISFIFLIPLFTVLLSDHIGKRLNRQMPYIAFSLFLWLWLGFGKAHPGWLVFFLVPFSNMIYHRRFTPRKIISTIIIALYIIISVFYTRDFFPESLKVFGDSFWHPGWIMLLLVPIFSNIFFPPKRRFVADNKDRFKEIFKDYIQPDDDDDFQDN